MHLGIDLSVSRQRGGFRPSNLANLALWLDATDISTFTFSAGTDISAWADKSGTGNNASQATANQQPLRAASGINGMPAVQFGDDDTNKLLSCADHASFNYTTFSLFVVFMRLTDTGAGERIAGKTSINSPATSREFSLMVGGTDVLNCTVSTNGTNETVVTAPGTVAINTPIIADTTYNSTVTQYQNGAAGTPSGSLTLFQGTSPFHIGSRDGAIGGMRGYIGEILFYNSALTAAQRTLVMRYLSAKWKITVS